jgi:glycine reductase
MSGPGAEYSLFSRKRNVVLVIDPAEGIGKYDHERAVRLAGIKAARYLGKAATAAHEFVEKTYQVPDLVNDTGLPRVVYVNLLIAQGLLHDNFIYGVNAQGCLATLLTPTEAMDGAIVSGNCAAPCHKNTTYHQQNNPIIEDLLEEHGRNLWFLGVIISPVKVALQDKDRSCALVHKLAKMLGAKGAVISEDGGGNPETDLMQLARLFERGGIQTVLVTDEYAGRDGASPGLADATPEADAVVTNGNGNQYIVLPPMAETIGHLEAIEVITGGHKGALRKDGSIELEIAAIMGSTVELGSENLTTLEI